jgi:hypothetical protein
MPAPEVEIESIGLRAIDARRVDVAVDLTPCRGVLTVEMVIVGPDDEELSSIFLVDTTSWTLDKVMHLRRDAAPGVHIFHVGVFYEDLLVARAAREFTFSTAALESAP